MFEDVDPAELEEKERLKLEKRAKMIEDRIDSFKNKYGERHELDISTANRTPADLIDEEAIEQVVADIAPVFELDTTIMQKKTPAAQQAISNICLNRRRVYEQDIQTFKAVKK